MGLKLTAVNWFSNETLSPRNDKETRIMSFGEEKIES
jgi:hypothetical protein